MKRTWLSLLLVALMMCTLVGCGSTKESDDDKEVTSEVTTETNDNKVDEDGNDKDTSMDGGAPVGETFDEATTEETTTEEVVPVEVTFTLMSEDGSAVAFEGTVPEGLTLVSGDGTNHIEFAYDENPAVTVYLDGGADNNVLVAKEDAINQYAPQYLENNTLEEATEAYLPVSTSFSCDLTINGDSYWPLSASLGNELTAETECIIWKTIPLMDSAGEISENLFTITVTVDRPDANSASEDEMDAFIDEFIGGDGDRFAGSITESFSN